MLPTVLGEITSMVIIFVIIMVTRFVEMATLILKIIVLRKMVKNSDKRSVYTCLYISIADIWKWNSSLVTTTWTTTCKT